MDLRDSVREFEHLEAYGRSISALCANLTVNAQGVLVARIELSSDMWKKHARKTLVLPESHTMLSGKKIPIHYDLKGEYLGHDLTGSSVLTPLRQGTNPPDGYKCEATNEPIKWDALLALAKVNSEALGKPGTPSR